MSDRLSQVLPVLKLPSPAMESTITTTTSNASNDLLTDQPSTNRMSAVKGVVVIARNGDRMECYQDPKTYKYGPTESTPFGEVWTLTRHLCFATLL